MFKNRYSQAHSVDLVAPLKADLQTQINTLSATGKPLNGLLVSIVEATTVEPNIFSASLRIRTPHRAGTTGDVADLNIGSAQQISLTFSGPLVTGNAVRITLTYNGTPIVVGPVAFVTDNNTTLQAVATAITAALPTGGSSAVLAQSGVQTNRKIVVNSPSIGPNTLGYTSSSVTGGASQATVVEATTAAGVASGTARGSAQSIVNGLNTGSTVYTYTLVTGSLGADGLRVSVKALPKVKPNVDPALTQQENNKAASAAIN